LSKRQKVYLLRKQYFLTGVNYGKASLEAVLRLAPENIFLFFAALFVANTTQNP
jgi:hypothetical protein